MSDEQEDEQSGGQLEQSGEQATSNDPPQAAADTDQAQSDVQQSDDTQQAGAQSGDQPSGQPTAQTDQAVQQTNDQSAKGDDGTAQDAGQQTAKGDLNSKRQAMLDLINTWMPTSLNNPRVPDGQTEDLMAKAGWTKARGQQSKQEKDAGGHPVTSCGDILAAMLREWKSNFIGAFMIRDQDAKGRAPGAKGLGYYVDADGVQSPQAGDIIVLRNGVGQGSAGSVGHVGILVEAGQTEWRTADGGGGALPDQTASVTTRTVRFENNIPILKSPTDLKEKQLDGWVDLDKLEQTG